MTTRNWWGTTGTTFVAAAMASALIATGGCEKTETPTTKPDDKPALDAAKVDASKAKAGEAVFNAMCVACHSVGAGDRTGPDLKDVHKRRDAAWLSKWMKDPTAMLSSDPAAKELLKKFNGVPMPNLGLNDEQIANVLAYVQQASSAPPPPKGEFKKLEGAAFDAAKLMYFNRCAGCHGTLRAGATGPSLTPDSMKKFGPADLHAIIFNGTAAGMPAWGKEKIMTDAEVTDMAAFLMMEPPDPPQLPLEEIKKSWKEIVPVAKRPKKPEHKRNWENFFGVVLRDAGQVAIIDGDTKEQVTILNTGFAVHILRASSTGRYFLAVGRDGKVTMIDLWSATPTIVAQAQGCFDARSVDGSKFKGFEDKFIIQGCYWPPQYIVYDGLTLEPKTVTPVLSETYDTKEPLKEVRVAAIYAMHDKPLWAINLKESGFVGMVDYSKPGFPMVQKIPAERFLHDGGWDATKRYLLLAANMRNKIAVVDTHENKTVALIETGNKPHPGRGSNWVDPKFGPVNGTVHIGEGKFTVYATDPVKHPEHAWKVVREIKLPAAGGLFNKTHDKSPWVWLDSTLSSDAEGPKGLCVYSKAKGDIEKCWKPATSGRIVHFEYNKNGDEVWVSVWDKAGEIIIYDDKTMTEKQRIKGDWMVTPTGKFNVYNTAHDVY